MCECGPSGLLFPMRRIEKKGEMHMGQKKRFPLPKPRAPYTLHRLVKCYFLKMRS